jgi:hypothetical protein
MRGTYQSGDLQMSLVALLKKLLLVIPWKICFIFSAVTTPNTIEIPPVVGRNIFQG